MGTLSTSNWLENSVLDEIYGWEAYLACPLEEPAIKFKALNDLSSVVDGSLLDQWMDLSA